jgi:hypothetical protein
MRKYDIAFFTGFFLAITNPFMIAYWLIGARFLVKIGLIQHYSNADTIFFLIVGSLGIGSYLIVLAAVVYRVKKFLSDQAIRRLTFVFGIILFVFASYFVLHAASTLGEAQNGQYLFGKTARVRLTSPPCASVECIFFATILPQPMRFSLARKQRSPVNAHWA